MKKNSITALWFFLFLVFGFQTAAAQRDSPVSPALGPAAPGDAALSITVPLIRSGVEDQIKTIVTSTNNDLAQSGDSARLIYRSTDVGYLGRFATAYPDQPNQWYSQVALTAHIEVNIPYLSNRQLYIPININATCDGWYTANGRIRVVAVPGLASIEGGNIFEEILNIKNAVDSRVRSRIPQMSAAEQSIMNVPCRTIGVYSGQKANHDDGYITFDLPAAAPPYTGPTYNDPTVEVTFLKLKRLAARDSSGGILYDPVETVRLETYTDQTFRQSAPLMMAENNEVILNLSPAVVKAKAFDQLIIIANIRQQTDTGIPDSNYAISYRSGDFSPGLHTVKITKLYSMPPSRTNPKPLYLRVAAYELTYNIKPSLLGNY